LKALGRWLRAFTPEDMDGPGRFSVMSVRATPSSGARVNLYLRPAELELHQRARIERARDNEFMTVR
jgi:hypothetical protein